MACPLLMETCIHAVDTITYIQYVCMSLWGRIAMAPIPAFDSAVIIILSVLLPAACWLAVHRSAPPKDRVLVSSITATLLACWTLAAFSLCIAGAFHPGAPK